MCANKPVGVVVEVANNKKWLPYPDIHTVRVIILFISLFVVRIGGHIAGVEVESILWIAILTVTLTLGNAIAECEREIVRLSRVVDTLIINSTKKGE